MEHMMQTEKLEYKILHSMSIYFFNFKHYFRITAGFLVFFSGYDQRNKTFILISELFSFCFGEDT